MFCHSYIIYSYDFIDIQLKPNYFCKKFKGRLINLENAET